MNEEHITYKETNQIPTQFSITSMQLEEKLHCFCEKISGQIAEIDYKLNQLLKQNIKLVSSDEIFIKELDIMSSKNNILFNKFETNHDVLMEKINDIEKNIISKPA